MEAGLLSRSELIPLTDFLSSYSGDTLWALMVYWLVRLAFVHAQTRSIFLTALMFSFAIEFSQLFHAPWIDMVRSSRFGGLVLGFGFKFSDLICYIAGVFLGAMLDSKILRRFIVNIDNS